MDEIQGIECYPGQKHNIFVVSKHGDKILLYEDSEVDDKKKFISWVFEKMRDNNKYNYIVIDIVDFC